MQADGFEASYGGAESNVAVSLATLGDDAAFLTKLPKIRWAMPPSMSFAATVSIPPAFCGGGARLGIYFFEKGSDIRPTSVLYDRAGSALAEADADEFNWEALLSGIDIFFFSGVTPAISPSVEQAVFGALKYCHSHGITVICDLNYRAKMWSQEKAQSVMKELMQYVDLCIANDEDFEATLGIHAFDGDGPRHRPD